MHRRHYRAAARAYLGSVDCRVICFTIRTSIPSYLLVMRGGLAIAIVAFLALSVMARGHPHFVPRPTAPMPAVNVP
jgi:hypothetical protein